MENIFSVNKISSPQGIIVVIVDLELKGKVIENEKLIIDLSKEFYKGEDMLQKDLLELLNKAYIVNFTGEKSIDFGMKLNLVHENNIIKIDDIPHAETYLG
ncbi:DUF424 family protein [archaeon]|jgi:hypothetical protein|nr:DUF424 family protein [archaeon]